MFLKNPHIFKPERYRILESKYAHKELGILQGNFIPSFLSSTDLLSKSLYGGYNSGFFSLPSMSVLRPQEYLTTILIVLEGWFLAFLSS